MHLPLRESLEQIPDRIIGWETHDPQQAVQRAIGPEQSGVRKAPCPAHHRDQKGREGLHRIEGVRRVQLDGNRPPPRCGITALPQKLTKTACPPNRSTWTR